jgi:hypothetical protein
MPPDPENHRLSLSEERLRLALSELELRLRVYFDEQLAHKADKATMIRIEHEVEALDRGDFTKVHQRALRDFILTTLAEGGADKWRRWQRVMAVCAILIAACSFILTAVVTLGGVD